MSTMDRNIALIILDTVRKDRFDDYAPRIQSRSDCSFDQCKVSCSWSTPSHASILTGKLLHKHGVQSNSQSFASIDPAHTFLGDLSHYHRICATHHALLQPKYSFDKFFDVHRTTEWRNITNNIELGQGLESYISFFKESIKTSSPYTFTKSIERALWSVYEDEMLALPYIKRPDMGASEITRIARKEIDRGTEPFCLFINYLDAHSPYRVNKYHDPDLYSASETWEDKEYEVWEMKDNPEIDNEYTSNYRDLYSASIDYLDRQVSSLIDYIQQTSDRETTILITADHGHNLGYTDEDYLFSHDSSMSEGILHVPLEIVNPPSNFPDTVTEQFSQLDLRDLVVRIANDRSDIDDLSGSPIAAEHEGIASPQSKFEKFPGTESEFEYWNRMIRVLYDGNTKYEWDTLGEVKKYQINPEEPCRQELIKKDCDIPAVADEFFDVGIEQHKQKVGMEKVDPVVEEDLRDLGYL